MRYMRSSRIRQGSRRLLGSHTRRSSAQERRQEVAAYSHSLRRWDPMGSLWPRGIEEEEEEVTDQRRLVARSVRSWRIGS